MLNSAEHEIYPAHKYNTIRHLKVLTTAPEFIKKYFMLKSAEHEIYPAHKC